MTLAICNDRICSGRVELTITQKIHFLDSIFSTNGCFGTHFMDVDVCMHKLKTKEGVHIVCMCVEKNKLGLYLVYIEYMYKPSFNIYIKSYILFEHKVLFCQNILFRSV